MGLAKDFAVEPYSRSLLDPALDLLARTGHQVNRSLFLWEFERNPVGEVNIHLAVSGKEVIGIACHNSFRLLVGDSEELVSFPLSVVTDERFRGRGIFSTLEVACEEEAARRGCNLMLSFPNDASTPIFVKRLGWRRMRSLKYVARPLRFRRLLPPAFEHTRAAKIAGPAIDGSIDFLERLHRKSGSRLIEESAFGDWSDDLFERARGTLDCCMARDSDYLNWRFVEKPLNNYRIFRVNLRGRDVGYLVAGKATKKGNDISFIASSLLVPHVSVRHEQIRAQVGGELNDSAAVRLDLAAPRFTTLIKQLSWGYIASPKRLNFIAKPLTDKGAEILNERSSGWRFQLGDLDFF